MRSRSASTIVYSDFDDVINSEVKDQLQTIFNGGQLIVVQEPPIKILLGKVKMTREHDIENTA